MIRAFLFAVFVVVAHPAPALATVKYLALNGFEDPAGEADFWWWDQASGGGISYNASAVRGGAQSAAVDCSTSAQVFFHQFYDELTNGQTPITGEGHVIGACVWMMFPPGSVSDTGTTDLIGLDLASSGHGNGTGQALIRAIGDDSLQIGGTCTTTGGSTTWLTDGEWHQYCIGYTSTGTTGNIKVWFDRAMDLTPSDSCSTGSYSPDPDGVKVTCFEAIGNPVTAPRYVDDLVVLLDPGSQEQVRASIAAIERLDVNSLYAAIGLTLRGDCSAQTGLECVDGTYAEPGNGTDNDNPGTHAIRFDNNADCAAYRLSWRDTLGGQAPESVYAISFEMDAIEETTNSQLRYLYNSNLARTSGGGCSSTSGDEYSANPNIHNALRMHKYERTLASDGVSVIEPELLDDVVVGLDKNVGSGNVRVEAWYVQALVPFPYSQGFVARATEEVGR